MRKMAQVLLIAFFLGVLIGCAPVHEWNLIGSEENPKLSNQEGKDELVNREELLQVIICCEEWNDRFSDLFILVDENSWAPSSLSPEKFQKTIKKALAACEKFIKEYQDADFHSDYITIRAEIINSTTEMQKTLQKLSADIENNEFKAVFDARLVLDQYRKTVSAHQKYFTKYLTERVHLLPETHYPPVAKEYYLNILRAEGMDWIFNFISVRDREGRQAFSLEKLKGHAETAWPQLQQLYNEHRFLNVPQRFGARNYKSILIYSASLTDAVRSLAIAITNNDQEKIDYELDGIKLLRKNLSHSIKPFI